MSVAKSSVAGQRKWSINEIYFLEKTQVNFFCCIRSVTYPNIKKSVMLELVLNVTCSSPNWECDACETIWKVATTLSFHWKHLFNAWWSQRAFPFLLLHVPLFPLRAVFSVRSIFSLISPFPFCLELISTLQWNVLTSPLVLSVCCSSLTIFLTTSVYFHCFFSLQLLFYCYNDSFLLPPFYLHITL